MNISDNEAAYLAGFFDGEGSVCITRNMTAARAKNPSHILKVSIGNTDPRVIKWIQDHFGGTIHFRVLKKKNWRNFAQWSQVATGATNFLKRIQPFVRMKADQIDSAVAFQESKSMRGPKIVPKHVLEWRESKLIEIQNLNARSWIGSEERNRNSTFPRNYKTNSDFAEEVMREAGKPMTALEIVTAVRERGREVFSKASMQCTLYSDRSRFGRISHGLWVLCDKDRRSTAAARAALWKKRRRKPVTL